MKLKSWFEKFDETTFFTAFLCVLGILFGAQIIRDILLNFLPKLSQIIGSLIFIGIYLALFFFSMEILTKKRLKKFIKYFFFLFLIIEVIFLVVDFIKFAT